MPTTRTRRPSRAAPASKPSASMPNEITAREAAGLRAAFRRGLATSTDSLADAIAQRLRLVVLEVEVAELRARLDRIERSTR